MDLLSTHRWFNSRFAEAGSDEERFDVEKARGVTCAYLLYYENDGFKPRGCEVPFTLPIEDSETGGDTGYRYSGIVDSIVEDSDGRLWFMDHKTATNPDRSYWQELKTNPQLTQYLLAAFQMDLPVAGCIWDVIQKPAIKPKDLTKKAIAELENGEYCGLPFKPGYQGEESETPQMYGLRVYSTYASQPDKYFERRKQYRSPEQLLKFLWELNQTAKEIGVLTKEDRVLPAYSACKSFGSLCEYHQICAGDDPEMAGYRGRQAVVEGDKRTASGSLSISRTSCYLTCRQKYSFRYLHKIEPIRQEYNANLSFGSLVHEAIENWLMGRIKDPIVFPNE